MKKSKSDMDDLIEKLTAVFNHCNEHAITCKSIIYCTAIRQAIAKIEIDKTLMCNLDKAESWLSNRGDDNHVRTIERLKKALTANAGKAAQDEQPKFIVSKELEEKTGEKFPSEETVKPQ